MYFSPLATTITRNFFKIFIVKQEKHVAFKLFPQNKLDSIVDIISQKLHYGDISSTKYHKILQELEKYCQLKTDIRYQAKTKVIQITTEKQEKLLEKGKKEGKENFLQKIASTSGIKDVIAI